MEDYGEFKRNLQLNLARAYSHSLNSRSNDRQKYAYQRGGLVEVES